MPAPNPPNPASASRPWMLTPLKRAGGRGQKADAKTLRGYCPRAESGQAAATIALRSLLELDLGLTLRGPASLVLDCLFLLVCPRRRPFGMTPAITLLSTSPASKII